MREVQMAMSKNWSNAIALYMSVDWGLKCESLNPPYAEFKSPKTNGKVRFEIYFTNYFVNNKGAFVSTETIDTRSIGNSDYTVLCIWNKSNNNCVVLKTEDAVALLDNRCDEFNLSDLVPLIKRKFEIGVRKRKDEHADIPNDSTGQLQEG